jgi:integrase
MAANANWLASMAERRKRKGGKGTGIKMWQIRTSFSIPGGEDPIGRVNLKVAIRPYGHKDCSTDIKAPRACIKTGRIQVPDGDEYLKKLRTECDQLELTAHRAFVSLKLPGKCPTPREVIDKMKAWAIPINIANTFDDCVKEFRDSKKDEWTPNTEKFLDNMLAALKRFMTQELHVEQILLHEINVKFLTRFQLWMKRCGTGGRYVSKNTGKGLSPSSVRQYMMKLTQVLEFAYINDYISVNPCDKFEIMNPQAENAPDQLDRKVSVAHQNKLESTPLMDDNLERGRLLIILQTWTGFSYEDLVQHVMKNCIHKSLTGIKEIRYNRVKTGELAMIPLFDETVTILEKLQWNNNPGPYRTYLRLVKTVFAHFGIPLEDQDGTHTPRHLFGNRMLEKGFTMESVSRMMGHGSVTITESIYAKINSDKIQADYSYVKKREAM